MSRFSPTVVPTSTPSFLQQLNAAFDEFQQTRRQKRTDTEHEADRDTAAADRARALANDDEDRGYVRHERTRHIGQEEADDQYYGSLPGGAALAAALSPESGPPARPATPPPADDRSWSAGIPMPPTYGAPTAATPPAQDLAMALRGPTTPPPMAPPAQSPVANRSATPPGAMAATHPAAFDPTTRTFGPPRVNIDPRLASQSPAAQSELARRVGADEQTWSQDHGKALAEELRAGGAEEKFNREQQGRLDLEDMRQQGRMDLRSKIDVDRIAQILTQGQQARTTNAAKPGAGGAGGGKPMTEAQRQANALKAAEGVLQDANGDESQAADWLDNTDEGRYAKSLGMTRYHLHVAAGNYVKGATKEVLGLQKGLSFYLGDTPDRGASAAAASMDSTRAKVRPPAKPAAAAPPPPAPTLDSKEVAARAAWVKANPPKPGETRAQYETRYTASKKGG